MGTGLVGLFVKPTLGLLDFAKYTALGLRKIAKFLGMDPPPRNRRRLPRMFFGIDRYTFQIRNTYSKQINLIFLHFHFLVLKIFCFILVFKGCKAV